MEAKLKRELREAVRLARIAGEAVLPFYGNVSADLKEAGSPVTAADRAANQIIVEGLKRNFPHDGILSEESRDSAERLTRERVWVVDPLDGTREFIAGIDEFAVMIGLAVKGSAVLGVVYCPADDTLYTGIIGEGAWLERRGARQPLRAPQPHAALRLVGSRSHPDELLVRIQEDLGIEDVRPSGSVGVKCGLVALGECDLYVHPVPYLKEWDTCAPEVVLRAAGGVVTDCIGDALVYNKADPKQPTGIVATLEPLYARVIDKIRARWQERAAQLVRAK